MPPLPDDIIRALSLIEPALPKIAARLDGRVIPRLNNPYLARHYFIQPSPDGKDDHLPGVLLHKFISSDAPNELHNHPWEWALSIILSGRYYECRSFGRLIVPEEGEAERRYTLGPKQDRVFEPFDVNILMANDFHRVELIGGGPVWTLFVHGPRVQSWGFVPEGYDSIQKFRVEDRRTFTARKPVAEVAKEIEAADCQCDPGKHGMVMKPNVHDEKSSLVCSNCGKKRKVVIA